VEKVILLSGVDWENLLVKFLSELLFLSGQEKLAFDDFDLRLEGNSLEARLNGAATTGRQKEIKAVTYHNLSIQKVALGLIVNLVFDV
jgi:SHS2 domain-containing protein